METITRPIFSLDQVSPKNHWILEEIEDINADALDASCYDCEAKLSWAQWLNSSDPKISTKCHSCDHGIYSESFLSALPEKLLKQIAEPGYFDRTWYHASTKEDWARSARSAEHGELIVHAGSKLAALSRADDVYAESESKGELYLHSFSLRSSRSFARSVLYDMVEDWQDRISDPTPMELEVPGTLEEKLASRKITPVLELTADGYRGAPYYNRYELPGDISILFHAKLIQLNTVETVKLERH